MWFNFIKIKKTNIFNLINYKDIKKKITLFNEKKIINIINYFIVLKKLSITIQKSRTHHLVIFYASIKNILKRHNVIEYNNVLQVKSTKKQLFSTAFNKKKIVSFISNGFFIKKLLLKKNQKKDWKVSILNLKKVLEFLKNKNVKNLIINLNFAKLLSIRYIHFMKSNLKKLNTVYIYSPFLNFSKKKHKKVKSIKRKLKKKYNYSV